MIVKCTHCEAAYSVDDEKVNGKKFGFECPKCGTNVIIDNRIKSHTEPVPVAVASEKEDFSLPQTDEIFEETAQEFGDDFGGLDEELPPVGDDDLALGDDVLSESTNAEEDLENEELSLNVGDDFNLDLDSMDISEEEVEEGLEDTAEPASDDELMLDDFSLEDEIEEDAEPIALDADETDEFDVDTLMQEGESAEEEPFISTGDDLDFSLPGDDEKSEDESEEETPAYDDYGYEDEIEPEIDLSVLDRNKGEEPVAADDDLGGALREESFADADDFDLDLPEIEDDKPSDNTLDSTDDDVTLDLDTLDIDLDESGIMATGETGDKTTDDDITLDLDTLDIDLDESDSINHAGSEVSVDDDITLDMDSLDIDLDESGVSVSDDTLAEEKDEFETSSTPDDDITLDLDSLDLELEDDETISSGIAQEDEIDGTSSDLPEKDDDITLDIDSLDINLDDNDEIVAGQNPDDLDLEDIQGNSSYDDLEDESRLSLDDAGLSLDELENSGEESIFQEDDDEEDLKLSLEEIDPSLNMEDLGEEEDDDSEYEQDHEQVVYDDDEIPIDIEAGVGVALPEVDIDRFEADNEIDDFELEPVGGLDFEDETPEYLQIEEEPQPESSAACHEKEYWVIGEVSGKGYLNFSIDYSLRYSRVKALLRLLGLYILAFIPHFVVFIVYAVLAFLLGVFNWVIVLFSGRAQADYILIQENTLRYGLGILSSFMDVIEDMPPFAGTKDIDYSLQMNVVYPEQYSRVLAFLRISIVGILVMALPHLILFVILTMGALLFSLIGMIAVLFNAKWPNIFFDFMVRYFRYTASVWAYITGVIDTYPSFRFE